jgi:flagellar L-ring protein precursor FlgH
LVWLEESRSAVSQFALCLVLTAVLTAAAFAAHGDAPPDSLSRYLARVTAPQPPARPLSFGSLWIDSGKMASLSADYKAMTAGDLITIVVSQGLISSNTGAVGTNRSFSASSGVDNLPGKLKIGGLVNLFGLHSAEALTGKSQASSNTTLTTTLAGRVIALLPGGNLVVEAERVINMNHEKQTILVRGVVRPGDIGPGNTVASNAIADLELEVKGKGVISDGVRPPHALLRALLSILNF